jgi:GTP-binding protein
LIEGAHTGVGLGHEFLRHVERNRLLVHLVEPFPTDGSDPVANYRVVRHELEMRSEELARKPEIIAMSKCELSDSEEARLELSRQIGKDVLAFSAVTGRGLSELMVAIQRQLDALQEADTEASG